ncbi:MAG TPA: thermonuclease family protein [Stellaceae bacterium]|nr:thermonuclease family protein [Stellaceae bacterium]
MIRRALACLLFVIAASLARSAEPGLPAGLEPGGSAVVEAVIDGDSLTLADGRTVRMVGIQAPKLPKSRPNFAEWPFAREAEAALADLVQSRTVSLHFGGSRQDRYGRVLAQLVRDDGLWVQGELLRRGMARVYTFPDNRAVAAEMLTLEREARTERRGLWAAPFFAIRKPEEASRYIGDLQLVEGRIVDGARTENAVFLNFGADWHTAFTLRLNSEALRLFHSDKVDPLALIGAVVRVRGYVRRDRARAIMDITHPEEIERL